MSAASSFQWNLPELAEPYADGSIEPPESCDKKRIAELEKKVSLLTDAAIMFLNMKSSMETEWIDTLVKKVPDGGPMSTYKLVLHKGFGPKWDQSKPYSKAELKEDIITLEEDLLQSITLISEIGGVPYDPLDPDGSKAEAIKKDKERAEIQAQIEALKAKLSAL